jgi:hypothetical protein
MAHRGCLEQPAGELVEQRLEGVVAVAVDEDDVRVRIRELLRGADPGEASAQDQDARARTRRVLGRADDVWDATAAAPGPASPLSDDL